MKKHRAEVWHRSGSNNLELEGLKKKVNSSKIFLLICSSGGRFEPSFTFSSIKGRKTWFLYFWEHKPLRKIIKTQIINPPTLLCAVKAKKTQNGWGNNKNWWKETPSRKDHILCKKNADKSLKKKPVRPGGAFFGWSFCPNDFAPRPQLWVSK